MNKSILFLKREGKTLPEIGKILRLSRARLLEQYKREIQNLEEDTQLSPFALELPNRVRTALCVHYGGDTMKQPAIIAKQGVAELEKASHIGITYREKIARALHKLGYIVDAEKWLAGEQ